jgi:hypothetical protein
LDSTLLIGSEDQWKRLTLPFLPSTSPIPADYTLIWCIRAMMDKSHQFYQQAAHQETAESVSLHWFFQSVAEVKRMMNRRLSGLERTFANQAWKELGFPPGLLGKE